MNDEEKKFALYENFQKVNSIAPEFFEQYEVKRGLRNPDGTGAMSCPTG